MRTNRQWLQRPPASPTGPTPPTLVRGIMAYGRSAIHARRTEFGASIALARRARDAVVGRSAYLTMMFDSHLGQVAMVRGQVREALRRYRSADRTAKKHSSWISPT